MLDYVATKPERLPRAKEAPRVKATPMALRTADALGVDLATVAAPGAGGRITKADVEAALPSPTGTPATVLSGSVPMSGLRRIIAERMLASDTATARVTLVTEADAT